VCQLCNKEFQAPNPLKLHLALSCGSQSIDELWHRFSKISPKPSTDIFIDNSAEQIFPLALKKNAPSFNASHSNILVHKESQPLHRELSASVSGPRFPSVENTQFLPSSPNSKCLITDHYAHLESVVSNMGKAKNGHVCLYCGKLYSRKYGLKIHIRTHTGFKPLQCKICHRPFGDPSNLNKHVRLHADGNTPYRYVKIFEQEGFAGLAKKFD